MAIPKAALQIDSADFGSAATAEQLEILKAVKLSVSGNDRFKDTLTGTGTLRTLLEVLGKDEVDFKVLQNISIIISSFSYTKKNTTHLINSGAIECIISSCINHLSLCPVNLKTLINILSLNPETHIDLSTDVGRNFVRLLIKIVSQLKNNSSLVFTSCILIPYLPRSSLVPLVRPILSQLSVLLKPVFQHISKDNSLQPTFINYENCMTDQSLPISPPKYIIPNEVSPLLYSLAHIIPELDSRFKLPKPLYFCLTAFLTNESMNIRSASANVLTFYAKYHLQGYIKDTNYKKLVPPLINMVHQTRNFKYEEFTSASNYRIKHEMTPLYLLSILCKEDDILIDYLANCRIIDEVCDIIIQNYSLTIKFKSEDTLNKVSDCFLVLSGICSSREHYREEIVKYDLSAILVDILTTHLEILKELQDYAISNTKPRNADLVFELSNNIALSACYFIRSLSRSVSLLRTYLLDLKITDLLVEILKFPEPMTDNENLRGAEIMLKSVILGIMSNFVLDFSSLKQDVLKNDIASLITEFLSNSTHDLLKIYSLTLVSNYLCGLTDLKTKDAFIKAIPMEKIFELCYHSNIKIQERCFSIVRNLCSCSVMHSKRVLKDFPNSKAARAHNDTDFLAFLTKRLILSNPTVDVDLISNICFTLVHLAASTEKNRSLITSNTNLLHMIYSLLDDRQKGVSESKIISPCIWILINLTWKDDTSSSDDEGEEDIGPEMMEIDSKGIGDLSASSNVALLHASERASQLNKLGFYNILKRLSTESVMLDNRERSKTALYQLCSY